MKAYGKDGGGHREGRRNIIDSYTYRASDGSNRMRIRFNVKGLRGHVRVWAEVFSNNIYTVYLFLKIYKSSIFNLLVVVIISIIMIIIIIIIMMIIIIIMIIIMMIIIIIIIMIIIIKLAAHYFYYLFFSKYFTNLLNILFLIFFINGYLKIKYSWLTLLFIIRYVNCYN
jgi:hypothetical protein